MKTKTYRDPVVEVYLRDVDRTLLRDMPTLIKLKRAAGRSKDLESIAELTALLEEREK